MSPKMQHELALIAIAKGPIPSWGDRPNPFGPLIEAGLAELLTKDGIQVYSITDAGREELQSLNERKDGQP